MFEELLRAAGALPRHEYDVLRPDLSKISDAHDGAVAEVAAKVQALLEERAGFVAPLSPHNAPYRLRSIRLTTVLPARRRVALESKLSNYNDEIAALLPKLVAVAIARAMTVDELARERLRDERVSGAQALREQLGIFDEVVEALDALYNGFGVSRWHWAAASDDDLRSIAAILKRLPIDRVEPSAVHGAKDQSDD